MTEIIDVGIKLDTGDVIFKASDAERMFHRLGQSAEEMQGKVSKSADGFRVLNQLFTTFVSVGTVVKFFHDLTAATIEHEQAELRLGAILRATGNAAGFTTEHILDLSEQLGRATLFTPEQFAEAAGTLATFRNITGKTFEDALRLSGDLAQTMHTDVTSAALQLGKALSDPVSSLGALTRAGITFSPVEKSMIKDMTDVGNIAGAQAIILGRLAGVQGTAAAAAAGLAGAIHSLRENYDDFLASLGKTQQIGGPLEGLFTFLSQFFRERILTTKPIEDLQIQLNLMEEAFLAVHEAADMALNPENVKTEEFAQAVYNAQRKIQSLTGINPPEPLKLDVEDMEDALPTLNRVRNVIGQMISDQREQIQGLKDATKAADDAAAAAGRKAQEDLVGALRTEQQEQAAQKLLAALRLQVETFGLTDIQAQRVEVSHAALSRTERILATAFLDQLEAMTRTQTQYEAMQEKAIAFKRGIESQKESLNGMIESLEIEVATFGMSTDEVNQYRLEIEAAKLGNNEFTESIIARGRVLNAELAALRANQEAWDAYVRKVRKAEEDAQREAEKTTIQWKRAKENMQDIFADFISDTVMAKGAFEDFVKAVLDMWIRMMAQIAAAQFFQALSGMAGPRWGPISGGAHDSVGMDFQRAAPGVPGSLVLPARVGSMQPSMTLHQNVNFNIQALDQRGVAQIIREQKGEIAAILLKATQESQVFRNALARG